MKKINGIIGVVVLGVIIIFLLNESHYSDKQAYAANHDISQQQKAEKETPVSNGKTDGVNRQAEIDELAKNNPNILVAPEYAKAEDFISDFIKLLNRENQELVEATDKYTYEHHIVTAANEYATHFLELKDDTVAKEKLEGIQEIVKVVYEKMKANKLDEATLERTYEELRTYLSN
ncbi:hypothetical protein [Paucisalibacillus globulus]|uniref:hypothetical protein n=1 Tax=Paucisalibacillus globulus TaxID=351095 RepID=UPI000BB939B9|nr:hypothetical protein [Paucisalibacillus globulus]